MQTLIVALRISAREFERVYAGTADTVLARSVDGRSVRFPAHVLRRYVEQDGVHGSFRIAFDDQHRFVSIERV